MDRLPNIVEKFKNSEKGNLKILYKNILVKTCFAYDAAYSDRKDLAKRTVSDKILKDRAHKIPINLKYDRCQRGLGRMIYNISYKKTGLGAKASVNEELDQELHKFMIKKFMRRKVYARFKENIW